VDVRDVAKLPTKMRVHTAVAWLPGRAVRRAHGLQV